MREERSFLLVEDEPDDAALVVHACRQAGMDFRWRRVQTAETMLSALSEERPDLILSDYRMPRFDGAAALQLAREHAPDVPFIIVTGSLNEEIAVECMRNGAADYILKERLARLPLAVAAALDVAAERRARRTAEEQAELQAVALELADHGVVVTDAEGNVTWSNGAFAQLTGLTPDQSRGRPAPFLDSDFHPPAFYRQLWQTVRSGQVWRREVYTRRANGTTLVAEVVITPVRGADGRLERLVAIQQDLTARKHQEEEIRQLSFFDPLTRLPNRANLQARLGLAVAGARADEPGAFLLFAIEHFRDYTRSFGTAIGDRIILWVANRLSEAAGDDVSVARVGSDEFALLLPAAPIEQITAAVEQLRSRVGFGHFAESDCRLDVSLSLGVALIDGQIDPGGVWTLADTALAMGRELESDKVIFAQDEAQALRKRATEVGRWAARVSEGLRSDQFLLHYQPIVDLATGSARHFEVLVRMRDGENGLVPPIHFLPAAERFGLMPQLDRWVVDHAIAELAADPRLRLFVNLSGASLADEATREHVERRVAALGESAVRLFFEITETSAVGNLERVRRWILRVKSLGSGFALDDFGTGFSSFSYLRSLPVDYVKIDGSFVKDLDANASSRALVQAMTAVAHALGQQVVAEAVEREAIVDELRKLGVDLGQGYLWARPAPLLEAARALDR